MLWERESSGEITQLGIGSSTSKSARAPEEGCIVVDYYTCVTAFGSTACSHDYTREVCSGGGGTPVVAPTSPPAGSIGSGGASGTGFPSSPAINQVFSRTDADGVTYKYKYTCVGSNCSWVVIEAQIPEVTVVGKRDQWYFLPVLPEVNQSIYWNDGLVYTHAASQKRWNGKTYDVNTVSASDSKRGIDCNVFTFTPQALNWQEAGIRNHRIKIVWVTPQETFARVIVIPGDIYIGLPLQVADVPISAGAAANTAKKILDDASGSTAVYITSIYGKTVSDGIIINYFLSQLSAKAKLRGGEGTRTGRGYNDVIINDARYVMIDFLNDCE